jgi:amino acid permease
MSSRADDTEANQVVVELSTDHSIRGELHRWFETAFGDSSSWSCFFNLANTIVGAGMLGLPYAFAGSGWVVGTVMLVVCGLATIFALHLLSLCAAKVGKPASFYTVAMKTMPSLTLVIDFFVAVMTFGVGVSYLVVVASLMPDVMDQLGASHSAKNRDLWVFLGFAIAAPLSCMRTMDSLKFTSLMCLMMVIFTAFLVLLYSADISGMDPCAGVDDGETCKGGTTNAKVDISTFQRLPIIVFAYTCHQNIFGVTNELRRPTQPRVDKVINMSVSLAFVLYIVVACCGYYTYGDEVNANILVSFPKNGLTSAARAFIALMVAFSYPLQCHPCRTCVLSLLHHWDNYVHRMSDGTQLPAPANSASTAASPVQSPFASTIDAVERQAPATATAATTGGYQLSERAQQLRWTVVTAGYLGLSLLIALTVDDLGLLLGIVGSTGSTMVSFILPGFFYYILFKDEGPAWKRYLALFMGCAGLVIMPVCLTFLFV